MKSHTNAAPIEMIFDQTQFLSKLASLQRHLFQLKEELAHNRLSRISSDNEDSLVHNRHCEISSSTPHLNNLVSRIEQIVQNSETLLSNPPNYCNFDQHISSPNSETISIHENIADFEHLHANSSSNELCKLSTEPTVFVEMSMDSQQYLRKYNLL